MKNRIFCHVADRLFHPAVYHVRKNAKHSGQSKFSLLKNKRENTHFISFQPKLPTECSPLPRLPCQIEISHKGRTEDKTAGKTDKFHLSGNRKECFTDGKRLRLVLAKVSQQVRKPLPIAGETFPNTLQKVY